MNVPPYWERSGTAVMGQANAGVLLYQALEIPALKVWVERLERGIVGTDHSRQPFRGLSSGDRSRRELCAAGRERQRAGHPREGGTRQTGLVK